MLLGARLSYAGAQLQAAPSWAAMKRLEDDEKDPEREFARPGHVQLALRFVPSEEAQKAPKLLSGVVSDLPEEEVRSGRTTVKN